MKRIVLLFFAVALTLCSCQKDDDGRDPINDDPNSGIQGLTDFPKIGPDSTSAAEVTSALYRVQLDTRSIPTNFSWTGIALEIGKKLYNKLTGSISNTAYDYLKKRFYPSTNDEKSTYLLMDSLLSKVTEIDRQMNEITTQLANITDLINNLQLLEVQSPYQALRARMISLNDYNDYYLSRLRMVEDDSAQYYAILKQWAENNVNGSQAIVEASSFTNYITTFVLLQNNNSPISLCSIFDMLVYNSVPWESLGYDMREQFRLTYAMVALQSLELAYMYDLSTHNTYHASSIVSCMKNVNDFFDKNTVDRQTNRNVAVCQIKGAHIKINRTSSVFNINGFTLRDDNQWLNSDQMLACFAYGKDGSPIDMPTTVEIGSFKQTLPTSAELTAIANYYKGSSYAKTHTLLGILAEVARVTVPENLTYNVYLPTQETWLDARRSVTFDPWAARYLQVDMHLIKPASFKFAAPIEDYFEWMNWKNPASSYDITLYSEVELPVGDQYKEEDGYPFYRKWKLPKDSNGQRKSFANETFTLAWLKVASRY